MCWGGGGLKTSLKARARSRRAVIKSERESSRFVEQKSYYWSKYYLKREVLKVSFEGREGRAVKGSKRKRIPDLDSRATKGTTIYMYIYMYKYEVRSYLQYK